LRLLVPHGKRNLNHEKEILFRLKDHFNKHFKREERKVIHTKREGIAWFLVGTVLMIIATFVSGKEEFIMKLVETMLIPAGWFMFWEGLSKVFITSRENFPDYGFYNKIKNARVKFFSY